MKDEGAQPRKRAVKIRRRGIRARFLLLPSAFILALLLAALCSASSPVVRSQSSDRVQVVRIAAPTAAQRLRLAALGLDLLEHTDGNDLFALVGPDQLARLRRDGWDARVDAQQTALLPPTGPRRAAAPPGYRTVEQTEQFLRDAAAAHPGVATLVDYGDSWQKAQPGDDPGHDLLALRITHPFTSTPKPVFALIAAIHARELATSELATRFVDYLLANDGVDPDVTWMLDDYEVVVIPIANPDGRALADQGWLQRKNTDPGTVPCPLYTTDGIAHTGVDLNRNASFEWNGGGSSGEACDPTYRGVGAASEPEEAALETFLRGLFPDNRGPNIGDAAPADTPGVLISLHSFADLVLWPWGHTNVPAPNADGLERLGQRMAALNGYTPQQAIDLYPTSGTTDDWLYGERGVAAYTFEVGPTSSGCGGFFPAYSCLDEGASFWPKNLPAFLYALRVARAPYAQPAGPDVRDIAISSDGITLTVTATLDNSANGGPVSAGELYLGRSPFAGGAAQPLQPVDGAFDAPIERVYASLPAGEPGEKRLLLLRGDAGGVWGPLRAAWSTPSPSAQYRVWMPLAGQVPAT